MNAEKESSVHSSNIFIYISILLWIIVFVSFGMSRLDVGWWMSPAVALVMSLPFAVGFTIFAVVLKVVTRE